MAKEIERKFLVQNNDWKGLAPQVYVRQGYLCSIQERVVRIRTFDGKGFVTIKGKSAGMTRSEFEYQIPFQDAEEMLNHLCEHPLIEKKRSTIGLGDFTWEVDEFLGKNQGLVVAEVELSDERQQVPLPAWIGQEVTGDPRYFNSNLQRKPYTFWNK